MLGLVRKCCIFFEGIYSVYCKPALQLSFSPNLERDPQMELNLKYITANPQAELEAIALKECMRRFGGKNIATVRV